MKNSREKNKNKQRGFTLIETIIYAALISVIIGMTVVAVYQIIQFSDSLNKKNIVEEEANFILRKIGWALAGTPSINSPVSGTTSTVISINKINYSANPIIFDLNSQNLRIKKGGSEPVVLNSQNVAVNNVVFEHIAAIGNKPDAIKTNFQINEKSYQLLIYLPY